MKIEVSVKHMKESGMLKEQNKTEEEAREFMHSFFPKLKRWECTCTEWSCEDFLSVLSSYQNEDGGFGYNIEANNWNPNSSPYTVCIALDYLDTAGDYVGNIKHKMVQGIIKYLAFGAYLTENGWVGMQGIPTNNDFAHMPWFHYDPQKPTEADVGLTKRLSDFILVYAGKSSDIYQKAAVLKAK